MADVIERWHLVLENQDFELLQALPRRTTCFILPWSIVQKRDVISPPSTCRVLLASGFHYRNEIICKSSACLECLTEIDGLEVNGADLIHWNDAGLITKFKALTRRLKAVNLVHQKMNEMLASG